MFKAIIFDLDGVIVRSEASHYAAYHAVFANSQITIDEHTYLTQYAGLSDYDIFKKILAQHQLPNDEKTIEKFVEEKARVFPQYVKNIQLMDGVLEVLESIKINFKLPMAICTGARVSNIQALLSDVANGKVLSYMDVIVTASDVKETKPSPACYLLTAKKLKVQPKDCLVIEDTPTGISAGKAAGMTVWALNTSYPEKQLFQADKIISTLREIPKVIRSNQ